VKARTVTLRYSRTVPFSVPEAYAWLTDYRDDDPTRTNAVQKTRRVISRTNEGAVLEAELQFGKSVIWALAEIKLSPPDRWQATFLKGPLKGSVYEYRLTPIPGGCRLDIDHHIRATRLRTWLTVMIGRRAILRQIHKMWEGFAASMAREIPRAPAGPLAA